MSKENAIKFISELQTNEELKARAQDAKDPSEIAKIAAGAGYDVTPEELMEADKELRSELAARNDETVKELSPEELMGAAGGAVWTGEDAPDGHEMGCFIAYHHGRYSKEQGVWCQQQYFCTENNRDMKNDNCGATLRFK